ncbi:hypothetical protein pb186bvf_008078 [Paramecium bursaria]
MKSYSIVIPLSVEEYQKGVKFVDYLIDLDLSKQTQQKVEITSQTPYIKTYYLHDLPEFVQNLTAGRQIQIQERKHKRDNNESRQYNINQFPGLEVMINFELVNGDKLQHDPIDIVNEQLDYFKGYEKDCAKKFRENFGIVEYNNWKRFCPNLSTCNVNIEVRVNYGDESATLEGFILEEARKFVVYFIQSMLFTYRNWNQYNEGEIFRLNKQLFVEQLSTSFRLNLYPQILYQAQDLNNKTKYQELKKTFLKKYIKQNTFGTPSRITQSEIKSPIVQQYSFHKSQEFLKKNLLQKRSGQIYKKGDGPIDYNWNQRYVVLDGETLIYFKDKFDKNPRGVINLRESYVSPVTKLEDREHGFYIEIESLQKQFFFSGENMEESEQWREEISQATLASTPRDVSDRKKSQIIMATNTYLLTETIPSQLQKYSIIQRMDDLQNEWNFRKFRNGVKIYEKPASKTKSNMFALYVIILSILLALIFGRLLYILPTTIIIILTQFILQKKKSQTQQVFAKLICEIDPQKAFNIIKNLKSKKVIDSNFIEVQKIVEQNDIEFTKRAIVSFIISPIRQKSTKLIKPNIIKLNLIRYRFIIKDGHQYVVDICQGSGIQIFEVYQIQRIPKVSGKGIINYYCEISTNKYNLNDFDKYLSQKAENLSLISQMMDEQRFHQFQQSIVNEITTSAKMSIIYESPVYKTYEEQLSIISQMKQNKCNIRGKRLEERKPGYRRFKEGGVECFNREEIRSQDGLVIDLMRQAGRQLMEGKNIISVSLPVRIFEARSMIERVCDWWGFHPIYLELAANSDPIERFKLVITMVLAGLYNGARQKKPFNPILGETFQGTWQDGTEIYIEHTSHHPPISHFFILDQQKRYKFYGHYEYQAALRYNAVIGHQIGDNVIEFNDGQKIVYNMPPARVSGLLFGQRVQDWYNSIKFNDQKNGLQCEVKFSEGAGMIIGRNAKPTDYLEGTLFHFNRVIAKITGSWLESVYWDNQKYWDIEKIDPAILIKVDSPLPSDCRYRTDLIELMNNDLEKAQEEKTRLEVIQRRDRKLRQDFKVLNKK